MKVQVLGTGCPSCKQLMQNVVDAAAQMDLDADIEKVEDIQEIVRLGVLRTPALAVDGRVRSSGRVLSVAEIKKLVGG